RQNHPSAYSTGEALGDSTPNINILKTQNTPPTLHTRKSPPVDVRIVLESTGFKVIKLFTKDVWHKTDEKFLAWLDQTGVPRELRGDNIFAVGRKQSLRIDRYPNELYD